MEPISIDELQRFVGESVEVIIQDAQVKDQAPILQKKVKKVQNCPDGTHIRFYFDNFYFLAVPLASNVSQTATAFSASDPKSGLTYTIKKVQVN
ncbi:hypothetical protein [Neobacillus sp. FSL H8-0543]|uniref:hypothetical protein n=1 Tax=Neobacillus sp. FSL H8-0543 TaxID=2954672 RepID=UPI003157F6AD